MRVPEDMGVSVPMSEPSDCRDLFFWIRLGKRSYKIAFLSRCIIDPLTKGFLRCSYFELVDIWDGCRKVRGLKGTSRDWR